MKSLEILTLLLLIILTSFITFLIIDSGHYYWATVNVIIDIFTFYMMLKPRGDE